MGITIDDSDVGDITIDGDDVSEVTIDGDTVWERLPDDNGYIFDWGKYQEYWDFTMEDNPDGSCYWTDTQMIAHAENPDGYADAMWFCETKIDLTDYDTLEVDWNNNGYDGAENKSFFGIDSGDKLDVERNNWDERVYENGDFSDVDTLDISDYSGKYWIKVLAHDGGWDVPRESELEITSLQLK